MADPRQHLGARLDLPLDPAAHVKESLPRRPHLGCPTRAERHHLTFAKSLGGPCHAGDRGQLIAQENIGDPGHQD